MTLDAASSPSGLWEDSLDGCVGFADMAELWVCVSFGIGVVGLLLFMLDSR